MSFHSHAFAFNKSTQQNIIHGGWAGSKRTDETYIMTSDEWIKAEANLHFNPGSRESHVMVYDEKRQTIILFGGLTKNLNLGSLQKQIKLH